MFWFEKKNCCCSVFAHIFFSCQSGYDSVEPQADVDGLLSALRDPSLPTTEFFATLSTLRGRIPKTLSDAIANELDEYAKVRAWRQAHSDTHAFVTSGRSDGDQNVVRVCRLRRRHSRSVARKVGCLIGLVV